MSSSQSRQVSLTAWLQEPHNTLKIYQFIAPILDWFSELNVTQSCAIIGRCCRKSSELSAGQSITDRLDIAETPSWRPSQIGLVNRVTSDVGFTPETGSAHLHRWLRSSKDMQAVDWTISMATSINELPFVQDHFSRESKLLVTITRPSFAASNALESVTPIVQ